MIQVENLKEVLSSIGFVRSSVGECFRRNYDNCSVIVDFDNKKILYPEDKGLKVNDKTTSNFDHPENFVVLDCVCRFTGERLQTRAYRIRTEMDCWSRS